VIPLNLSGGAPALAHGIARVPAGTRIHRSDKYESRGERDASGRAGHDDHALLEGLTEEIEHVPLELKDLIEKEDAVMGERDLAWPRLRPATDERRARRAVVRCPKRPRGQ
jgi:hypothetical protein